MSETPIYFFLAQLNSLLTSGLRLGYAFFFLSAAVGLFQFFKPFSGRLKLDQYWACWSLFCGLMSLGSALGMQYLLRSPNTFLQQGLYSSIGLCLASLNLLIAQKLKIRFAAFIGLPIAVSVSIFSLYSFSFSRSDKDLFSILLSLPLAVALSYFPLCFLKENPVKNLFHYVFLILLLPMFLVYYGWMYPLIKHIPAAGEFYPFINLYDWILPLFVILYLGNVYIDYWLKKRKSLLAIIWNYPVAIVAVLCQWLNTNILDTLAL